MHFHETKCLEVWKYWPLKDSYRSVSQKFYRTPFCGEWTKKNQTFSRHFSREKPSKYCIVEFTTVFVCLLLSWSRRYSMKWSSNFDGRNFSNSWLLHLTLSNMINLCPNIRFTKNSKCQQYFLKTEPPKKHNFFIFLKCRYFVMGGPITMMLACFERLLWAF